MALTEALLIVTEAIRYYRGQAPRTRHRQDSHIHEWLSLLEKQAIRYYRAQAPRTRHPQDSHKHERLSLLEKPDSELPSEDELSPTTSQPPESRRYPPPTNGTSARAYYDDLGLVHTSSPVVQANPRSGLPPPSVGRTSSVDVKPGTVQARPTWPRNEKGTYLPA